MTGGRLTDLWQESEMARGQPDVTVAGTKETKESLGTLYAMEQNIRVLMTNSTG